MGITAAIFGCSGLSLTQEEKDFYKEVQPWGFILFGRNVDTPEQVTSLVTELKSCVDHADVPILIDQEGGRVRRLRPPHWEPYPAGEVFGQHYHNNKEQGLRFAWLQSRLMACDLLKLGVNVDCLPVLDVPVRGSHDVIGDRAYGNTPDIVSDIGRAASIGLLSGGVLPVVKHIPGHGRASVDSHKDLPVVHASLEELERSDFEPFKRLNQMPLAMTAMCDDLSMHALKGTFEERTKASFEAGCDVVLHCNGDLAEMMPIAAACPELSGDSLRRAVQATDLFANVSSCEEETLRNEFRALCSDETYGQDPTEAGH